MIIKASYSPTYLQPLFKYLEQFHPLSVAFVQYYQRECSLVSVKKNKFILSPFDTNDSVFFLLKGVVRGFIKEEHKDISTWFGFEHEFVEALKHPQQLSNYSLEYIQAIEDCELIRIPYKLIHLLNNVYPEANLISRKLLAIQYYAASERSTLARIPTALGRYSRFTKSEADISRIPQRYLASYLGMRLETLSRIKNRLSTKPMLKIA
ncbi:Crp/Fnr family transcriptional regulator [Pedobacter aquatilis]|uniref:Crp/Fnr family transcriptional regulator n=1 Tax=Pedobacter aquatilis TaxID=351343 RepID=UPI002931EB75|nr:Crp/Fnr family transcriptional regulator [Pedobacter aquatilis]